MNYLRNINAWLRFGPYLDEVFSVRKAVAMLCMLAVCISYAPPAQAQSANNIVSSARQISWGGAGISGGIPSLSWSQCGSTINPGASAATILAALQGCAANHYVQLASGTFNISTIHCTSCNFTELRGMGADQTHLVMTSESSCQGGNGSCAVGFEGSDNTCPGCGAPAFVNWTAGYSQGSSTITLSNLSSITANVTNIFLDQCDTGYSGSPCAGTATDNGNYFNCGDHYVPGGPTGCSVNDPNGNAARPHRFQWEIHHAVSCSPACGTNSSGTVTLDSPLQHPNWASGNTPQAWFVQPAVQVGVRNLSIDGNAVSSGPGAGVSLYNCYQCWATGVAVMNTESIGIYLVQASHDQVESNYVYNAGQGDVSSDPSGINYQGSDNLIQNNIVQRVHVQVIGNGPDNGNVVAYNYLINSYGVDPVNDPNPNFLFGGLWDGHSNGVDYNLFEGNVANQVFEDQIHGTHLMETWYRNFLTGWETCGGGGNCGTSTAMVNDVNAAFPLSFNRYGNWVGNVMGTPGINNAGYQSATNEYVSSGTTGVVWILGSGNQSVGVGGPIPVDAVVASTIMRWANWDANTNAVRFCGNSSDTGWVANCGSTSEIPTGISVFPNSLPTLGDTVAGQSPMPASFYLSTRPSWWASSIPFPAIGPDVSSGTVGKCTGTLNVANQFGGVAAINGSQCTGTSISASSYGGHVNAIPAMVCYLNVMGGPPDGSTSSLTFNANACYATQSPIKPAPATNVFVAFP